MTEYLLSVGANINARNQKQQTPLHWACMSGDIRSVTALVNARAEIDAKVRMIFFYHVVNCFVLLLTSVTPLFC
jgi:ankyrin repeat protein